MIGKATSRVKKVQEWKVGCRCSFASRGCKWPGSPTGGALPSPPWSTILGVGLRCVGHLLYQPIWAISPFGTRPPISSRCLFLSFCRTRLFLPAWPDLTNVSCESVLGIGGDSASFLGGGGGGEGRSRFCWQPPRVVERKKSAGQHAFLCRLEVALSGWATFPEFPLANGQHRTPAQFQGLSIGTASAVTAAELSGSWMRQWAGQAGLPAPSPVKSQPNTFASLGTCCCCCCFSDSFALLPLA